MVYQPLIHADQILSRVNPYAASPAVDELLRHCFDSDILPSRSLYPRRFARTDVFAGLYTSERIWYDQVDFQPDGPDRHERYFHHLFWDSDPATPVICVIGSVGSGKSTLVDYYLRCYCPDDPRRRNDFERKLVIHFDARDVQDNTDFYHLFFLHIQSSVRLQCAQSQPVFDIDAAIKRRPTQPNNVREWAWAAFEELSQLANKKLDSVPFQYIAVVIDNLDQTPAPVQIRAITEVEQWLRNPLIRLWRVFLPLWPSTFSYLRNHRFNMLRGVHVVHLGPIDTDALFANHERAIEEQINLSSSSTVRLSFDYLSEISKFGEKRLLDRISGLSHGSLRLMLSLWGGFLRSEAAFSIWRQRRVSAESSRSFEYELLDALIVGAYEVLNQRTHRVANLFTMGHAHDRPRDLLVGPHALFLMAQGFHRHRTLTDALVRLGYSEDNIQDAIDAFGSFNILHQVPVQNRLIDYEIHDSVIQDYVGTEHHNFPRNGLIWEPAYVDNIAMVTPVDSTTLIGMKKTRGDRTEDFTARVETTLAFLRFLRGCEDSFRDPSQLMADINREDFRETLEKRRIPCLWRGMTLGYRSRLLGLQQSGYLKMVDSRWWTRILDDPLFATVDIADRVLMPL
ncbi:MAG: hypothetical protein P4L84_04460 [Isosphaeraceae bacterium]|nr:hypothetical protein [Isosphaeraceae bacterium]